MTLKKDGADAPSSTETPSHAPTHEKQKLSQETYDMLALEQVEESKRAGLPSQTMLGSMERFASHCVNTGQMPATIDTAAKAIMVFQAGRELGIPPIKALNSFYFVNNHLSLYGATVMERIRNWAIIEYGVCDDKEANVTITRKDDGTKLSSKVTLDDLKARGIADGKYGTKDTYKKHARTMLIYRAVGEIVRHIVPEAVGALSVEGDFDEEEQKDKKQRSGKTVTTAWYDEQGNPHGHEEYGQDQEINLDATPTVEQIMKYDSQTIKSRLEDLGVDTDELYKKTKRQLAVLLADTLKELSTEKSG